MTRLEELIRSARRLRPATREAYLGAVRSFVAFAGTAPARWTTAAAEAWYVDQCKATSQAAATSRLFGLKKASRRFAEVDGGRDFAGPVEADRGKAKVRPQRSLTIAEADRLTKSAASDDTWAGRRDLVVILLAIRGGLRCDEIGEARWEDLAGNRLTVHGKGGRDEAITLDKLTVEALRCWAALRRRTEGPVVVRQFASVADDGLGGIQLRMSTAGIADIIKARTEAAGIENCTPHALRHTCGTLLIAAGVPLVRVSKHLRHRDVNTTMNYYVHDLKSEAGDAPGDALDKLFEGGGKDGEG